MNTSRHIRVILLLAALVYLPYIGSGAQYFSPDILGASFEQIQTTKILGEGPPPESIRVEFLDGEIDAVITAFTSEVKFDELEREIDKLKNGSKTVISDGGMIVWRFGELGHSISLVAPTAKGKGPEVMYKRFLKSKKGN